MSPVVQSESLTTKLGITPDELFDALTPEEQNELYEIAWAEFHGSDPAP